MEAGLAVWGWSVRRPEYFTIYYRSTKPLQGNMRICQGNLKEFSGKSVPVCENPVSVPSRTVLWCRDGVVLASISVPHY